MVSSPSCISVYLRLFCQITEPPPEGHEKRKVADNVMEKIKKRKMQFKHEKSTRRISIGWKHRKMGGKLYMQVPISKGGGTHPLDVEKTSDLHETLEAIKDYFLPSTTMNVNEVSTSVYDF